MVNIVGKIIFYNGLVAFFYTPFHPFQQVYCQTALNFMRHLTKQMQTRNLIMVLWREILPWPLTLQILSQRGTVQSFEYSFPFLYILIIDIIKMQ